MISSDDSSGDQPSVTSYPLSCLGALCNRLTAMCPPIRALASFSAAQIVIQVTTLATGFCVVRGLAKDEYAGYAIANSVQSALNILTDLGIGVGLRSMGGPIHANEEQLDGLISEAMRLRRLFFAIAIVFIGPIGTFVMMKNGFSWQITVLSLSISFAGLHPNLAYAVLLNKLQLRSELSAIQRFELTAAAVRIASVTSILLVGPKSFTLPAILATNGVAAWIQYRCAARRFPLNSNLDRRVRNVYRSELFKLSKQLLPTALFFSLQSQVTLWILTFFHNRIGIADVNAAGRLAACFAVLSAVVSNIAVPYFARQKPARPLLMTWVALIGLFTLPLVLIAVGAYAFPQGAIVLLGSKYANMKRDVPLVVAGACFAQLSGLLWGLNSARGWTLFQRSAYIPTVILCQVTAALILDLSVTHNVILFSVITTCGPAFLYLGDALKGLVENRTWVPAGEAGGAATST